MSATSYRTIWLSDIHLGSKGCNAEQLLTFLKYHDSEYLILVGDIIDFWSLKRSTFWPTSHNTVVQKVLKKAKHGTKVIFIPGNHDEALREYIGLSFGDIELHNDYIHTLADGRTIFCLHGDLYDVITRYHKWVAVLGDIGYELLLKVNKLQNIIRIKCGFGYWSLSSYVKHKVKSAVSFIGDYEDVVKGAKDLNVDGVLCGHIHYAEIKYIDDILYLNTGDWVESCTAIVEHHDGQLELIKWKDEDVI
jgi:UDP-2,3-diacylglucosamine pyrophosphatase LpxH